MATSQKKVVVRQFDYPILWGYLPSAGFVRAGCVELLDPAGKVVAVPLKDIKSIAYVRDFNLDDGVDPERIGRRSFAGRPRGEGLWLLLNFRDRDSLEGLAPFDLAFLDAVRDDHGFSMTPPEARSNTQRLFIPQSALTGVQVLGWISAPAKQKLTKPSAPSAQGGLFET